MIIYTIVLIIGTSLHPMLYSAGNDTSSWQNKFSVFSADYINPDPVSLDGIDLDALCDPSGMPSSSLGAESTALSVFADESLEGSPTHFISALDLSSEVSILLETCSASPRKSFAVFAAKAEEQDKIDAHQARGRRFGGSPIDHIEDFTNNTLPRLVSGAFSEEDARFAVSHVQRRPLFFGPGTCDAGTENHARMVSLAQLLKFKAVAARVEAQVEVLFDSDAALTPTQEAAVFAVQNLQEPQKGIFRWSPDATASLMAQYSDSASTDSPATAAGTVLK